MTRPLDGMDLMRPELKIGGRRESQSPKSTKPRATPWVKITSRKIGLKAQKATCYQCFCPFRATYLLDHKTQGVALGLVQIALSGRIGCD